jgi:hypothetical protein
VSYAWGVAADKPVSGDHDGDGRADIGVYRDGAWYVQRSTAGFTSVFFGNATDTPVPAAFNRLP